MPLLLGFSSLLLVRGLLLWKRGEETLRHRVVQSWLLTSYVHTQSMKNTAL